MRKFILLSVISVSLITSSGLAVAQDAATQLEARLQGRAGNASEDRRNESFIDTPFGDVKTGCSGDTLEASISINAVEVSETASGEYLLTVAYSGRYERQGWIDPCVRSGRENLDISGNYSFTLIPVFLSEPEIEWGEGSDFVEVSDPNHDSNLFAIRAVQNAVASAF